MALSSMSSMPSKPVSDEFVHGSAVGHAN